MLIDTNVLLRFILQDHTELGTQATDIITNHRAVCLNEVIYESIHVLTKVYRIEREDVAKTLLSLFEQEVIYSRDVQLINKALNVFLETRMDFIDCLLIAQHLLYQIDIQSFDKKLNNYLARQ